MPPEELERVERFLAAFNAIDGHLQSLFAARSPASGRHGAGHGASHGATETHQSFRSLVDWFAKRNPWWPHAEPLRMATALRNLLVHETTEPRAYPCAPSEAVTARLERIRDELLRPERALPRWKKEVVSLQASDDLRRALRVMDERGFGAFPVYDGPRFRGVLSERDLARWLAAQSSRSTLDFSRAHVGDVLASARPPRRPTFAWASARTTAEEIAHLFHENTFLETVLVSPHGRDDEELQGIVTRADVVQWESQN